MNLRGVLVLPQWIAQQIEASKGDATNTACGGKRRLLHPTYEVKELPIDAAAADVEETSRFGGVAVGAPERALDERLFCGFQIEVDRGGELCSWGGHFVELQVLGAARFAAAENECAPITFFEFAVSDGEGVGVVPIHVRSRSGLPVPC